MERGTSGLRLVVQQYKALVWKNLLLSWRNKGATLVRLIAPFFFFLLVFFIQTTAKASYGSLSSNTNLKNPPGLVSPPIPPCEDKFFVKLPCFDFVWSGNRSSTARSIVTAIMANNPARPIPSSKVKSFETVAEVDEWLNENPMRTPGGLHLRERSERKVSYGLQINSTAALRRGLYEDPTFKFQIPLQIAAEREIARSLLRVPNFSWVVTIKEFAHPAMEILSALDSAGPASFLATAMFNFVFQMSALISEKETKLRPAMTMMGLYDSAYWLSWLTFDMVFAFVSTLLIVLFGLIFQFEIFLRNSFVVVFLVFFLFQLSMLGFAYMLSSLISMSSSSTTVGFSIFIIGTMTQLVTVFGFPYSHGISRLYQMTWSFFPPNLLAKALLLLSQAIPSSHDISTGWGRQMAGENCSASNHGQCVMTMTDVCVLLLMTFLFWVVIAIYLDNIVPDPLGARKSIFYFLNPQYWTGKGRYNVQEGGVCSCTRACNEEGFLAPDDEDVEEEERMVKAQTINQVHDSGVAVHIRGLSKTYPNTTELGCFRCKKTPSHHALKELWLNVDKGQLFCLLGPNGAGKTTTINCLTGFTRVSGGDASIYGNFVRSSIGMSNIRKTIGVCPQFDILWESLTGQDHLNLFASIKGINPASIPLVTESLLAETGLIEAARVRAGSYCGGMKRRLSVAIALIGDPKLVILDEPTTGADPIARRKIWDIIEKAKRGRAIILTTHSMEEADVLGDWIGIMTDGRLRCIGTSIRLKLRYGDGFIAHVSFLDDGRANRDAVKDLFKHKLDVLPKEENNVYITFVTPRDKETLLPNFYAEVQERAKEFGIANIQLGLTTLHEVFLNVAAKNSQQETESAQMRIDTDLEATQRNGEMWYRSRNRLDG